MNNAYDTKFMEKVRAKTRVTERGCWEWTGFCGPNGYGQVCYRGRQSRVHRVLYALTHGPIPDGLDICHTCDNPPCCNPHHLFAAPAKVNIQDMLAKGRKKINTHCPRGHAYAEHGRKRPNSLMFDCRTCDRAKQRIAAGWPEDLAYSTPPGYVGEVPKGMVRLPVAKAKVPYRGPRSTHCRRGHEYTPETVYVRPDGGRQCWICMRAAFYRNQEKRKMAASTSGAKE